MKNAAVVVRPPDIPSQWENESSVVLRNTQSQSCLEAVSVHIDEQKSGAPGTYMNKDHSHCALGPRGASHADRKASRLHLTVIRVGFGYAILATWVIPG